MKKMLFILLLIPISAASQIGFTYHNKELPCVKKEFQVYVHIALDSLKRTNFTKTQLDNLFNEINKVFEPICFSFNYCKVDTIIDYSFDHNDGPFEEKLMTSRFQQKKRINLYLIDYHILLSNSTFNSITDWDNCFIIANKRKFTAQSIIHELGNVFGLYHTNEGRFGKELVDGSNCATAGDLICDTPADPTNAFITFFPLREECLFTYRGKDDNGDFYEADLGNFMSPWAVECRCGFSNEQYRKMAENYLNSTEKPW